VVAGVSVSLQQVLNARLRVELGSPWWAGLVSFLGGSLVMLTVAIATGESLPSSPTVAGTAWASWTGGVFGAVFREKLPAESTTPGNWTRHSGI
jgi:bacterial/archaeal transporter family-2 protein